MDSLKDFLQHFDPYTTPTEVVHRNYSEYRRRIKTGENIKLTYNTRSKRTDIRRANRRRVIALKGGNCDLCGFNVLPILQVHHKRPVESGGSNDLRNYAVLCPNCHTMLHCARDHGNPEAYKQAFKSDQIYKMFESLVNYQ